MSRCRPDEWAHEDACNALRCARNVAAYSFSYALRRRRDNARRRAGIGIGKVAERLVRRLQRLADREARDWK